MVEMDHYHMEKPESYAPLVGKSCLKFLLLVLELEADN